MLAILTQPVIVTRSQFKHLYILTITQPLIRLLISVIFCLTHWHSTIYYKSTWCNKNNCSTHHQQLFPHQGRGVRLKTFLSVSIELRLRGNYLEVFVAVHQCTIVQHWHQTNHRTPANIKAIRPSVMVSSFWQLASIFGSDRVQCNDGDSRCQ